MRTYLALGDSMSIDDYTGVVGGGAVRQFFQTLGKAWRLDDRTFDGCRLADVPRRALGDVITLTAGGNDLLARSDEFLTDGVASFLAEHLELLESIRGTNPEGLFIVGDVYAPAFPLGAAEIQRLNEANDGIRVNCERVGARLAPIHAIFQGREAELLCYGIEPNLGGAREIANLFQAAYLSYGRP
jgi:lysophospholipase L1-like esterase